MPKRKHTKGHVKVKKARVRKSKDRADRETDPLLALRGSGKHIWADEHADTYIARLREGWD